MPPREWAFRIRDIIDAIDRISEHIEDLDESSFQADKKTIDAVLYCLAVIGEAAGHIPEDVRDAFPDLPWFEMQGMRNIVVHEYFGVSLPIIWHTVSIDLPKLREQLDALR